MNVLVLLAGVVNPGVAFASSQVRIDGENLIDALVPRRLSPFDESSLELALQLRDADPSTHLTIYVVGGKDKEPLLRAVLAFRPDTSARLELGDALRFDAGGLAQALRNFLATQTLQLDLILMGREFGDADDGVLPPTLAHALACQYFGLAQRVTIEGSAIVCSRERGTIDEVRRFAAPTLVSVTNDSRNRLRHPLMKNVMAAKRAELATFPLVFDSDPRVQLVSVALAPPMQARSSACRMIEGSVDQKVAELARTLSAWRDASQ